MRALGHSLTWPTKCFLGCDQRVYAHTNGYGDFVLLDSLGWPWPIHACYGLGGGDDYNPKGIDRGWDEVTQADASSFGTKTHTCLGTVTDIKKGALSAADDFQALSADARKHIRKALNGRTSIVTLVDGSSGTEFIAFVDISKEPLRFRDIVAADIKVVDFLNKRVFLVTRFQVLCPGSHA